MEYLSLKEYRTIAKKLLSASFPKVAGHIMSDDDKLGEIVYALAMADKEFDGRGSLYGYRKQRVSWAISSIYNKRPDDYSLNFNITDTIELCDTIPDKAGFDMTDYIDRMENLRDRLTNSKVLTEKEKTCIGQYFTENIELTKIASNLDIHVEAVKMSIRRGLSKMGLYNEYTERFEERKESRRRSKDSSGSDGV
jgi:predicted DNA-binding protein YlxM (UPF0122 family)